MTIKDENTKEFIDLLLKAKDNPALYISIVVSLAGTIQAQHGEQAEEITSLLSEYTPEQFKEAEKIILNHIRYLDESEETIVRGLPKEQIQEQNYAALSILREKFLK